MGFDEHALQVDPQLTNAPTDLTPAAGSPLIAPSDPASSPAVDITGKTASPTSARSSDDAPLSRLNTQIPMAPHLGGGGRAG